MLRRSSQHLAQATLGPQSDLKRKIGGFLTELEAASGAAIANVSCCLSEDRDVSGREPPVRPRSWFVDAYFRSLMTFGVTG